MNKQEALQKIKELQEYIEECDKRPVVEIGQLWQYKQGSIYIAGKGKTINFSSGDFQLVNISSGFSFSTNNGFDGDDSLFTYIGMAKDLLTVK